MAKFYFSENSVLPNIFIGAIVLFSLAIVCYFIFLFDSHIKIVCNKSKNVCSLYAHNKINKEYKHKYNFKFSDIKNVNYEIRKIESKTSSNRPYGRRTHNSYNTDYRYKVLLYLPNKSITIGEYSNMYKVDVVIKDIKKKMSDSTETFVLYES